MNVAIVNIQTYIIQSIYDRNNNEIYNIFGVVVYILFKSSIYIMLKCSNIHRCSRWFNFLQDETIKLWQIIAYSK